MQSTISMQTFAYSIMPSIFYSIRQNNIFIKYLLPAYSKIPFSRASKNANIIRQNYYHFHTNISFFKYNIWHNTIFIKIFACSIWNNIIFTQIFAYSIWHNIFLTQIFAYGIRHSTIFIQMSRLVGKPTMWFPTSSDTNRPVRS